MELTDEELQTIVNILENVDLEDDNEVDLLEKIQQHLAPKK